MLIKTSTVEFKYAKWKDLKPEVIAVNKNTLISFRLFSKDFEVVQIVKDDVTFIAEDGELKTKTLSEGFHFYRE